MQPHYTCNFLMVVTDWFKRGPSLRGTKSCHKRRKYQWNFLKGEWRNIGFLCMRLFNFNQASVEVWGASAGTTASTIEVHQEKPPHPWASIQASWRRHITNIKKRLQVLPETGSDWTRFFKKKLTCSLSFLCASNSLCNLSALSSAPSVFSCKTLIFRLTASSDVAPAIVPTTVGFKSGQRCAISDTLSSDELTSSIVRKLSGDAQSERLFVQEVPLISKHLLYWMVFQCLLKSGLRSIYIQHMKIILNTRIDIAKLHKLNECTKGHMIHYQQQLSVK